MKKVFIRVLCLLLGVNVFTACYGPGPIPENAWDEDKVQKELATLDELQPAAAVEEPSSTQEEQPAPEGPSTEAGTQQ